MSLANSMLTILLLLGLVGCAQAQPSIVGKWQLVTQGAPGSYASLAAEQLEFKSDGTSIVYDVGKYSLNANVLKYVRKTGTEYTYPITLEGNTLKGFEASEFKRVGGDSQAGIVGTWERGTPDSPTYKQVEFRQDGTFAVPLLGKYTLPDQKTVQLESIGGKQTFEFALSSDSLTLGASANALQYKRIK